MHSLGATLRISESPLDRDRDVDPSGQQMNLGSSVLHMLEQVIAVPQLELGST